MRFFQPAAGTAVPALCEPMPTLSESSSRSETAAPRRSRAAAGVRAEDAPATLLGSFLTRDEMADFRRGGERAYALTAALYATILLAFGAVAWTGAHVGGWRYGVLIAAAFVLIGWCQFSLSNGLHEALHRNFGAPQKEWLAALLTAYPIGLTLEGYRKVHFAHHRHFGDPERDPDFAEYSAFPRSRLALLRRFAWMASGLPALRQFCVQILKRPSAPEADGARSGGELLRLIAVQALIFAAIALTLGPLFYVVLWLLPLATVGKLLSSTRLLCEHGTPGAPHERAFVIRTITGSAWRTNLLGMYRFNLHGEHHLYPSVPYAMLDALARRHAAARADLGYVASLGGGYECFERGGYTGLLWLWFKQWPWTQPRA